METQLKIEKFLKNQYLESTLEKDLKIKDIDFKKLNTKLFKTLEENKDSLIKLFNNYKTDLSNKNKEDLSINLILNTSEEFFISIIFGRLLRILSNNERFNENTNSVNVYIDLGEDLINNYLLYLYKLSKTKESFSIWKKSNKNMVEYFKDSTVKLKLGSLLIEWLITLNLLEPKVITISRTEKHNILIAGSNIKELLSKNNIPLLHLPNKLPMIVPPKPYKKIIKNNKEIEVLGGYLLNDIEYTDNLILNNWELAVETKILKKKNIIYDMVNNISSVAYKINTQVLDFIINNYKKFNLVIDPDYEHPLTKKTKLTSYDKKELESFHSKRNLEQNILGIATLFKDIQKFYIPIRLDFRGRLNCISEYLNYQGTELAKALLLFSKEEKVKLTNIESINFLKIFGANCFGNKLDKASFLDRINWVDNNINNIENFENGILISKAENKLLFIAFCFEFSNYLNSLKNNLAYFITHLPIQLDASCNGFQHLTFLIGDLALSE
jgi:DNA-dependent RNA polymerase